jgi:hypothetical protein
MGCEMMGIQNMNGIVWIVFNGIVYQNAIKYLDTAKMGTTWKMVKMRQMFAVWCPVIFSCAT